MLTVFLITEIHVKAFDVQYFLKLEIEYYFLKVIKIIFKLLKIPADLANRRR